MSSAPLTSPSRWAIRLGYLVFFLAMGVFLWSQLPRGAYPTDLSRIGAGQPALVLAYDINSMGGMEAMRLLDSLRDEYGGRVAFLVADLGVPNGQALAQRHAAASGTVMTFAANGKHLLTLHYPMTTEMLREALDSALLLQRN